MRDPKALSVSSAVSSAFVLGLLVACSANKSGSGFEQAQSDSADASVGDNDGGGGFVGSTNPDGGNLGTATDDDGGGGGTEESVDPKTCDEAAKLKSYIGCDYWPTVVANAVWSVFDFAVVVANAGDKPAAITVTGPNGTNQTATVEPQGLTKIYLPWVTELKGPDSDCNGRTSPLQNSVFAAKGAYHLVSSVPVTVYQFNALEYEGKGGPPAKDWSSCPGTKNSGDPFTQCAGICASFTNDASLLLPSTAMTGNYRVAGINGQTAHAQGQSQDLMGTYIAITGTVDGTHVTVKTSATGQILAGGKIAAANGGDLVTFTLDAGDVAELVTPLGESHDLSGSQVAADKPVQVIAGVPCRNVPSDQQACDHLEQSVLPAETLGKHYVVATPTAPNGNAVGHLVRVFGNVDGTNLTGLPGSCGSSKINAGQVLDCGIVNDDFEVTGDHEFSIAAFMQGGMVVDPHADQTPSEGDPSQTQEIAVEQFRTKYIFLAPNDYDMSYVDVVAPMDAQLTLDGAPMSQTFKPIGGGGHGVARVKLGDGKDGAHVITGTKPFGIQVIGYGKYTSYEYPAGLDLRVIAPPPPPPK